MGCLTVFDLRSDNQTTTWLKTSRHLNKMYVRRLDEIEDFRFHVTHHPCTCNPTDPLSRHRFADGDGPALSKADTDPETQQGSSRGSVATHPRRRCAPLSSLGGRTLAHPQPAVAFANNEFVDTPRRCIHPKKLLLPTFWG